MHENPVQVRAMSWSTSTAGPRLLLLSTTAHVGGVERIVTQVSASLAGRGWRTRVVFPDWADERFLAWCRSQSVCPELSSYVGKWSAPIEGFRRFMGLINLVRKSEADVVNLHYGGGDISLKDVLAVRLAGVRRCVASVHHPVSWHEAGIVRRFMTRLAATLVSAVIVPSDAVSRIQRSAGISDAKIQVVPNGVPNPGKLATREQARQKLGLPRTGLIVASLARLVPEKRIDDLIRAIALLPSATASQCVLAIAGNGPHRPELERMARELLPEHNCVFLGLVPDASDVYAASDVFALPSAQEGFGLVFVEAALAGRPSIGTAVGAIPEVILHNRTGMIVPPRDPSALARAIDGLLQSESTRTEFGRAARERARADFSLSTMVDRYELILRGSYAPRHECGPAAIGPGLAHTSAGV